MYHLELICGGNRMPRSLRWLWLFLDSASVMVSPRWISVVPSVLVCLSNSRATSNKRVKAVF